MSHNERVLAQVRAICFTPNYAERRTQSDLYFMNLTQLGVGDLPTMAVSRRKDGPGLRLVYSAEFVAGLSDTDLRTILCHESQHLRRRDLDAVTEYQADRDWYNGWQGAMLVNMAADCIINDGLVKAGMPAIQGGLYGLAEIGMNCADLELEPVMREFAKLPAPPPGSGMGDLQPEGEESDGDTKPGEAQDVNMAEEAQEGERAARKAGKGVGKRTSLVPSKDALAWSKFLATVLDTRKQEDSFKTVARRLNGVEEFAERKYVRPAVRPLPRKRATIAIDTSGSMAVGLVQRLCNAVRSSPTSYELDVVCFNYAAHPWPTFRGDSAIPNVGGGTDLQAVVDYVAKSRATPERIIVLTDGEFEIPADLKNAPNWVFMLYGTDAKAWGARYGLKAVDLEKLLR